MVSFDVESLFTKVTIEDAVQAAWRKIENDSDLVHKLNTHTNCRPQYNGSIYEQQDGATMGSPVSAVIANIYMGEFEEQAIANATRKPKIWKRYVDNTFTVLLQNHVNGFL